MKHDEINNPAHYQLFPDMEAIDVIRAALTPVEFAGYLKGNALKYRLRAGDKGPAEKCIAKANWYQNTLRNDSPKPEAFGDFGQQNMLTPTVNESLTVGSSHSIPKWATHELTNRTRKSTGVYARFQDGQYLSERGRIYNMRRWAVVSQKFTPEQHTLTPADWPDENSPRNQRIHQNGELGEAIYAAVHGKSFL